MQAFVSSTSSDTRGGTKDIMSGYIASLLMPLLANSIKLITRRGNGI
jgi:hypothetical protein